MRTVQSADFALCTAPLLFNSEFLIPNSEFLIRINRQVNAGVCIFGWVANRYMTACIVAKVVINFMGNYDGTFKKYFTITQDPDTTEFDGEWVTVPKAQ